MSHVQRDRGGRLSEKAKASDCPQNRNLSCFPTLGAAAYPLGSDPHLDDGRPLLTVDHPTQIIFHVGVHCRRPPLPDDCPLPLASLIQRCWQDDPAARPAFTEVLHLLQVRGPHTACLRECL